MCKRTISIFMSLSNIKGYYSYKNIDNGSLNGTLVNLFNIFYKCLFECKIQKLKVYTH